MMKQTVLLISFLCACILAQSQQVFVSQGKVEYERKTNSHRLFFSGEEGSWVDQFKKLVPQFKLSYFDLLFTPDKSLYKPGKEVDEQKTGFFESPAAENI